MTAPASVSNATLRARAPAARRLSSNGSRRSRSRKIRPKRSGFLSRTACAPNWLSARVSPSSFTKMPAYSSTAAVVSSWAAAAASVSPRRLALPPSSWSFAARLGHCACGKCGPPRIAASTAAVVSSRSRPSAGAIAASKSGANAKNFESERRSRTASSSVSPATKRSATRRPTRVRVKSQRTHRQRVIASTAFTTTPLTAASPLPVRVTTGRRRAPQPWHRRRRWPR